MSRRLAPEDLTLWRLVTRDVAPLRPAPEPDPPPAPPPPPPPAASTPKPSSAPAPQRPPPPRPAAPKPLITGQIADVDRASAERLRRGRMEIDGRLDLHGMTQAQAQAAVERFIAAGQHLGRRCVLIVTGKGTRARGPAPWSTGDGDGVLRQALPGWLNDPPNRTRVLAVTPAQTRDGGQGAVYVLIKRQRDPGR